MNITISGTCPKYLIVEERHLFNFNDESEYLATWNQELNDSICEEFGGRVSRVYDVPSEFKGMNNNCIIFQTDLPEYGDDEGYPASLATIFKIIM